MNDDNSKCRPCAALELVLTYHENPFSFKYFKHTNSNTCAQAAKKGHLEYLKYAHENACEWKSDTCAIAAEYGELECLKYAHENGCAWY